ncbi:MULTISPECIES: Mu-like prophage major head subunit gpT family protein [Brucella]|uniref:Mu-like prophage major head subunit gpT family protein n=1 Tax=Brucella TaxID=234 RepID=UPI00124CD8D1|nr:MULTISPECIES: Mu-like prophage major head subunit gpT family protein [Brucella]KAB2773250.1 hypothetical protein F9L00_24790 [Brucella anthropi]MBR7650702.1 Mu-like prophage major head subunit gpT family protein [Brucella oryzae]MDG9792430.1 Mu-like prophage major head subunit gpT family protein [Brucella anthropi]MDH0582302.1 Mu-like prophage major head subunit gpT family protein [Brucella anthropi]MDH0819159.1 Mu-like prophage major head subunit gpT family protein [Brucella anthropi]
MDINNTSLRGVFTGFQTKFNEGLKNAESYYSSVAMKVPSSTSDTTYAWLGAMPSLREWIGDRVLHDLSVSSYKIINREFEASVRVKRTTLEDDQYGIFAPIFEKMGRDVAMHPDDLIFSLLGKGFSERCYDGQNFFDTDHPVKKDGIEVSVSNMQPGTGAGWYLLDCRQALKPMIYQERLPFRFTSIDGDQSEHVFLQNEFVYGTRGRSNAGYGLWQLAFGSKAELNAANYEAARMTMMETKSDNGKPLGIRPSHLVVPPSLEGAGRRILKAMLADGSTNEWAASAELIVTPYL